MEKEEILERSRKENKKREIYEIEVEAKALKIAAMSMVVLAFIFYLHEHTENKAMYSLITLYCFILYGYKAIKIKKNRWICIISSIIWGILTVMLILEYFKVI